ncbi:MAG: hypothetical protein BWX68_00777 [Verrucomicrobia bacterium ADurb.Bin063]|nr:MAG: hypothetical protein BWX68_00777 [Verrucomicrobia bacterium ADurb.Bin063]
MYLRCSPVVPPLYTMGWEGDEMPVPEGNWRVEGLF